jgi:hypothetical protein
MKRTLIYVLSFGLGALLLVALLSFTVVSLAEGLLPKAKDRTAAARKGDDKRPAGQATKKIKSGQNPGSKTRQPRGNEATETGDKLDRPL